MPRKGTPQFPSKSTEYRRLHDYQHVPIRVLLVFAKEYIRTGNATSAYLVACPHAKKTEYSTQRSTAWKILHKPKVQALIARLRERSFRDTAVSIAELVAENAAIVRFDPARIYQNGDINGDIKPWDEIEPEDRRCITEIKIEERVDEQGHVTRITTVKRQDRGAALDRLAKMAGAYARDNAQKAAIDAATAAAPAMDSRDLLTVAQRLAFVLNDGIRAAQGKPVITQPATEHKP